MSHKGKERVFTDFEAIQERRQKSKNVKQWNKMHNIKAPRKSTIDGENLAPCQLARRAKYIEEELKRQKAGKKLPKPKEEDMARLFVIRQQREEAERNKEKERKAKEAEAEARRERAVKILKKKK